MERQKPSEPNKPGQYNSFVRYSGLAIQMAVTIFLGHVLGEFIDEKTGNTSELYEKIITLLAVFLSIFMVIREVTKNPDNK